MTEEQKVRAGMLASQRRYSRVSFYAGSVFIVVTAGFPVIGSLLNLWIQVTGWNCRAAQVGECTTVCREIALATPWNAWGGVTIGIGLYLASAAFAQVAVGGVGKSWLSKIMPGQGGE